MGEGASGGLRNVLRGMSKNCELPSCSSLFVLKFREISGFSSPDRLEVLGGIPAWIRLELLHCCPEASRGSWRRGGAVRKSGRGCRAAAALPPGVRLFSEGRT